MLINGAHVHTIEVLARFPGDKKPRMVWRSPDHVPPLLSVMQNVLSIEAGNGKATVRLNGWFDCTPAAYAVYALEDVRAERDAAFARG